MSRSRKVILKKGDGIGILDLMFDQTVHKVPRTHSDFQLSKTVVREQEEILPTPRPYCHTLKDHLAASK